MSVTVGRVDGQQPLGHTQLPLAASFQSEGGAAAARELLEDERSFIDPESSPIWLAEEHAVVR